MSRALVNQFWKCLNQLYKHLASNGAKVEPLVALHLGFEVLWQNVFHCNQLCSYLNPSHTYMFWWTPLMALAAKPMFFRTSVLVLAFSNASLWNSMVERVPSIWVSCCSKRFFLFRACRAAGRVEDQVRETVRYLINPHVGKSVVTRQLRIKAIHTV